MMSSSNYDTFYQISKGKVTNDLLDYVTNEFESIIACPNYTSSIPSPPLSHTSLNQHASLNTPPSPPPSYSKTLTKAPMSLRCFIKQVISKSRIDTGTLLLSLSYARRLRSKLYGTSKGMECTHHRIFLATLIIAYKYIHDATIKNKYWVSYSLHLFSNTEVNLMEKQLLQLLDYNLEIHPEEISLIVNDISFFENFDYAYPTPPSYDTTNSSSSSSSSSTATANEFVISKNKINSYKPSPPLLHVNKI